MASSAYGIDLGTCNIKIYGKGDESVFCQKNIIAIENKDILFAYGDEAFDMYEKAPGNIHISYPLCNGVIADIKNMQTLVKCFVTDLGGGSVKPADYYIAVPTDVTEVEKRAFYDLVKNANVKAKRVMVVEKAIADGLGLDIDVKNSQGVLIVDVGFDTTEISILSLGGIVLSIISLCQKHIVCKGIKRHTKDATSHILTFPFYRINYIYRQISLVYHFITKRKSTFHDTLHRTTAISYKIKQQNICNTYLFFK